MLEAVVWHFGSHDFAFPCFTQLSSATLLGKFGPLILSKLVEDAVRELSFGRVVPPIVKSPQPGPVLLKLSPKEVVIGRLSGEAVPVLCQHHGHTPGGHKVSHAVHAGPLE
jgi:hypothetical protein